MKYSTAAAGDGSGRGTAAFTGAPADALAAWGRLARSYPTVNHAGPFRLQADMVDKQDRILLAPVKPNIVMVAADVVRDLMRSVAVADPTRPCQRAIENACLLNSLIEHCKEPVSIAEIMSGIVKKLADIPRPSHESEEALHHIARAALKYLADLSCIDDAARGRASRRERELESALKSYVEAEKERLRRVRENQRKWAAEAAGHKPAGRRKARKPKRPPAVL